MAEMNPLRRRRGGTIFRGANLTVKARDGMDVKIAVTDATRIQNLVKKSLPDIKVGDFLASTGVKGMDGKLHAPVPLPIRHSDHI